MNNPYRSPQFKRLKHRAKLYYGLAHVVVLPKYIGWLLWRLLPSGLGAQIEKTLALLAAPFRSVVEVVIQWAKTRRWKQLIYASPLLMILAWIFSSLFLANNMHDENLYGDYRRSLFNAVGNNDLQQAEFLAGKLLTVPTYAKDKQLLFAAMVSAHESANMPRRDMLLLRLTDELNYAPAYMWFANQLLSSPSGGQNISKAIEYTVAAIKVSDNPDPIRMRLAQLYRASRRPKLAIDILQEVKEPRPDSLLLLAELHLMVSDKDSARQVATNLLKQLDAEHPEMNNYMQVRIEVLAILADQQGYTYDIRRSLIKVVNLLRKKAKVYPDDKQIQSQLSRVYILISKDLFWRNNTVGRRKALGYIEKAVSTGKVPDYIGSVVLAVINEGDKNSMSRAEIVNTLVMGDGVALAHLLLGIDAWEKGQMESAQFHIGLAHAIEPEMLTVLRIVAQDIAKGDQNGSVHAANMSLLHVPLWRRTLELLDVISTLDDKRLGETLYAKYVILATRQRWSEVVGVIEPELNHVSKEYRQAFLRVLLRAHTELVNREEVEKYKGVLKAEAK